MKKNNKLLRNQKGSISMFVIVSVLFLAFVLIGIYASYANKLKAQEEQLGKIQENDGQHVSEDGMDDLYSNLIFEELPTGEGTTPWLPSGFTQVSGTTLETGLTITNASNGKIGTQSYVWIEVPTTIEKSITLSNGTTKTVKLANATNNEEIKLILKAYAGAYTKGSSTQSHEWDDEWYDGQGKTAATSTNLQDTEGCGMTYSEYKTAYNSMLRSIQKYGGFWLAQYEAGIAYEADGATTATNRTSHSSITVKKANYEKDQYPYNYVYCNEAQEIANADSVAGQYTSSLPFGIQWDLVCRFLEEKKAKKYEEIATNSTWGNCCNLFWTSSPTSRHSLDDGNSFIAKSYTTTNSENIIITTGALKTAKVSTSGDEYIANPMNIYDLTGNMVEYTLEHSNLESVCVIRGGHYRSSSYNDGQASSRYVTPTKYDYQTLGFRSVLYTVEKEYTELEYIKSTGTQYIDTGYYPDSNTNAKYKVSLSSYTTYGPHLLSSKNYYFPLLRGYTNHIVGKRGGTEFSSTEISPVINTIYEIEAFWDGKIIINGEEIGTLTNTGEADTTTLHLGAYGGDTSNTNYILNGKIYYCKIYNKNTLVRDYIPVLDKDGIACFYDKVEGKYYYNQGDGEFLYEE